MDLRVKKTKQSIREAFISLRAKKSLDRITVKELCENANINKTTFYLHYESIYDLSESIENELIENCFANIRDEDIRYTSKVVMEFYRAFSAQSELFRILFSDSRIEYVARKANGFLKERVFKTYPSLRDDLHFNLSLTMIMYGCFYAYQENKNGDVGAVIKYLSEVAGGVINSSL